MPIPADAGEPRFPTADEFAKVRTEAALSTPNVLAAFEVARASPEFRRFVREMESTDPGFTDPMHSTQRTEPHGDEETKGP